MIVFITSHSSSLLHEFIKTSLHIDFKKCLTTAWSSALEAPFVDNHRAFESHDRCCIVGLFGKTLFINFLCSVALLAATMYRASSNGDSEEILITQMFDDGDDDDHTMMH